MLEPIASQASVKFDFKHRFKIGVASIKKMRRKKQLTKITDAFRAVEPDGVIDGVPNGHGFLPGGVCCFVMPFPITINSHN